MKRYSIILPVYNIAGFIERAFTSAVNAAAKVGLEKCEIILVDDGSTDNSGEICDRLQQKACVDVRVVHKENGGLSSARNVGMEIASGEYVLFLDGDDWISEDLLISVDSVIDRFHPDAVKYGYSRVENGEITYSVVPSLEEKLYEAGDIKSEVYPALLGNGALFSYDTNFISSACMTMYKLSLIRAESIVFQSERKILNEDILFNLDFYLKAKTTSVLHRALYYYDCREGSLTQRFKPEIFKRKCALFDYFEEEASELNFFADKLLRERYAQFVIEHIYDCLVTEVIWNKNRLERHRNMRDMLYNPKFNNALNNIGSIHVGLKARIIIQVIKFKSPCIFDFLYKVFSGKG